MSIWLTEKTSSSNTDADDIRPSADIDDMFGYHQVASFSPHTSIETEEQRRCSRKFTLPEQNTPQKYPTIGIDHFSVGSAKQLVNNNINVSGVTDGDVLGLGFRWPSRLFIIIILLLLIIIISLTSIFFPDESRVWTSASQQH